MKKIKLTKGKVALVDDEDYKWLSEWKWHVFEKEGYTSYAVRRKRGVKFGRSTIFMHREIMALVHGKIGDGWQIDHINSNGLDNRRENIRLCTPAQNQYHARARGGKSKYKGVYWRKDRQKWISNFRMNGKHIHVGTFINEIDAAHAYDYVATQYFGEFAWLNFQMEINKNG